MLSNPKDLTGFKTYQVGFQPSVFSEKNLTWKTKKISPHVGSEG